ncbi:hypothetical protein Ae706Ps2_6183c [Pseudonocardia sp. Ae706_Ps2]|nr:hypothetical protein Ae331Ps2_6099c [Pseudonocardia sp. Ae331_Ps2]OLM08615.1 hypothetical protein Ae505Ps2_6002 [Pseudonocardia sp. Ae505_Ps2]OLM08620.1 hypothetical protein Ae505Ps2_6007 [Pseudonocardia sp. Ae505_Ps2]OLM09721.1 hypothetical protein Ae706Ps2_6183c [Pseudonocardia sp. Ae706_Ps2]
MQPGSGWALIEPLLPDAHTGGRPEKHVAATAH